MAFKKVVMTVPPTHVWSRVADEEECRKVGGELYVIPCETEEELISATQDAEVVIPLWLNRGVISKLNKCKLIHNVGTGYDGIDVKAATDHAICVSFPGDYCSEEVSEHVMALILACARKLVRLDRAVRAGKWTADKHSDEYSEILNIWSLTFRIKGQTLGIIGFGRIARLIVPKALGFGLRVIAFDPYVSSNVFKESGVESVTFDTLLKESDYISVNAALTEENRHLLGLEQFRKMKPTAYFINCARAGLVDEEALYIALSNGYIAGAGLDLVEGESLSVDHPLLKLDNIIITPHSSYYSEYSNVEIKRRVYEQIGQILRGEWPTWLINPEVKEKFLEKWGKV